MQKTLLCILYCVQISIYVSGFYLHFLNAVYNSHYGYTDFKKQPPSPIYYLLFSFLYSVLSIFLQAFWWVSKEVLLFLTRPVFNPAGIMDKILASVRKASCCRYWPLCQILGYKQSKQYGKQRCNMIFKG